MKRITMTIDTEVSSASGMEYDLIIFEKEQDENLRYTLLKDYQHLMPLCEIGECGHPIGLHTTGKYYVLHNYLNAYFPYAEGSVYTCITCTHLELRARLIDALGESPGEPGECKPFDIVEELTALSKRMEESEYEEHEKRFVIEALDDIAGEYSV